MLEIKLLHMDIVFFELDPKEGTKNQEFSFSCIYFDYFEYSISYLSSPMFLCKGYTKLLEKFL